MAGEDEDAQFWFELIEEVKKHPVIFDKLHPNHFKTNVTNEVWSEIGIVLGVEGKVFDTKQKAHIVIFEKWVY